MKTEAPPEYNISHHTPNPNRRARHRDPYNHDDQGKTGREPSGQRAEHEAPVRPLPLMRHRLASLSWAAKL